MTTPKQPARKITMQAPVLFIPNVLDAEFCKSLIHIWETQGNEYAGLTTDKNGQFVEVVDREYKLQRAHLLKEEKTLQLLKYFIRKRVCPHIKKAFHFEVTRFEGFTIAHYDAETGGYFRPHRDNALELTAYRRFAMTINLNVGEYEGGCLRFLEYGSELYEAETGSAMIFSASLLHEVTDLIKGKRFSLVSFFYGEEEVPLIEEYNRRVKEAKRQVPAMKQ